MERRSQSSGSCEEPQALSDIALVAAIDGEADAATQEHLRTCTACAQRAQTMRQLQDQLRARLYRLFCPASDLLMEYHLGRLDIDQRNAIAEHMATCPHCAQELELFEAVVEYEGA